MESSPGGTLNPTLHHSRESVFSKRQWQLLIFFCLLIIATFFFDNSLLRRGVGLRFSWLDGIMLYLTDFGLVYFIVSLVIMLIIQRKWRWLGLLALSSIASYEASYLLKLVFQTPRPYFSIELETISLTLAAGYSFPSLHSVFCLGLIPFLPKIFTQKYLRYGATILALLIAYSRAYLGVHYFSDLIAGGLIGYYVSIVAIAVEEKFHFTDWLFGHVKSKLELRRQIAHLVLGMIIVFLIELKLMTPNILFIILLLGLLLSMAYKYRPIPVIHELLQLFERPSDIATFPGRGPIFLILGALLSLLIFPLDIAEASIAILAVGDSVSHLVGRYFGKIRVPFSNHKMIEGTVVAIAFSTLAALRYVDFHQAFLASLITISLEAVYPEKLARFFDDNLMVPLMAGGIMLLLV